MRCYIGSFDEKENNMGKNIKGNNLPKNISQLNDGRYLAKYTSKFGGRL